MRDSHEDRDPKLDLIVSRILTVAQPNQIILFGSRARGEAGPYSDYDVVVVDEAGGGVVRSSEIRRAIGGIGASVDVLLATPEEMEERREGLSHVLALAQREGIVLYAA